MSDFTIELADYHNGSVLLFHAKAMSEGEVWVSAYTLASRLGMGVSTVRAGRP